MKNHVTEAIEKLNEILSATQKRFETIFRMLKALEEEEEEETGCEIHFASSSGIFFVEAPFEACMKALHVCRKAATLRIAGYSLYREESPNSPLAICYQDEESGAHVYFYATDTAKALEIVSNGKCCIETRTTKEKTSARTFSKVVCPV